jgi:quercetin dioxygenase-like cupin family protein
MDMKTRPAKRHPDEPDAYAGAQPFGLKPEMVQPGALTDQLQDDNLWVPQGENVWFKPLMLNTTHGYFVNLLRVRKSGVLSCHRHTGPVHAFVLKGRWYYLEHDWIADEGGYVFEPPGEIHTLYVPPETTEMVTLFHVTGSYVYLDADGQTVGYEDVFSKIDNARRHYASIGLGEDHVAQFIR